MKGTIIINNFYKKNGIIVDNDGDNFFISNIENSFTGDLIEYEIINELPDFNSEQLSYFKKKYNFLKYSGFAKVNKIFEENNKIFGILNFESKIQYGKDEKDKWLIPFRSMNNFYPDAIITSKNRYKTNQYAWVNINRNKIKDNKYYGNCLDIIGEINNKNNDFESCLYQFGIKPKIIRAKQSNIDFKQLNNLDKNRFDLTDKKVFSIDSETTKDIDDAIHCELNGNILEIGIHIAEPSYFIERDENIFNNALHNISSFYFPHKRVDMIGKNFSENYCSLNEDEYRFSYSTIIKIDIENEKIQSEKFSKSLIINNKKLSYNNVNSFLKKNKSKFIDNIDIEESLILLKEHIKLTSKIILNREYNDEYFDSNKIIEELMIINNSLIAKYLYHNKPNSLLRIHHNKNEIQQENNKIKDKKVLDITKFMKMEKGYYKKSSDISDNELSHDGLNLKYYTHFTSPIRRFTDTWNQLQIKNNNKYNLTNLDIFNINYKTFLHKLSYKDLELAEIYHNYDKNNNEYYGTIIEINYNQVLTYIEDLNKIVRIKLVDNKLSDIINIDYSNNNIILNKNDCNSEIEQYQLSLYQKIKLKVNISSGKIKWKDKLFFQIIKPSLSDWLLI